MSDISLTLFKSKYDNKTDKQMQFSSFDEFENLLYSLSKMPRKGKEDSNLISPAQYKPGTNRRCNDNVESWSAWCALDVDDYKLKENLENDLINRFGNWRFICYSTASSTRSRPKFRLVFPLTRTVESTKIRHFWFSLNTELDSIGDKQAKDLSRMYYIPAQYASAYNFIFSNPGNVINPDDLMKKHSYIEVSNSKNFIDRLPPTMQKEIIKHRKESMDKTKTVKWLSYTDCPFVNQNLINEYRAIAFTDNSGRYAMIYKIMVSIATNAVRDGYPIQTAEIINLIRQLDLDTSNRYQKRRLDVEANRALEFAYRNM